MFTARTGAGGGCVTQRHRASKTLTKQYFPSHRLSASVVNIFCARRARAQKRGGGIASYAHRQEATVRFADRGTGFMGADGTRPRAGSGRGWYDEQDLRAGVKVMSRDFACISWILDYG